MAAPVLKPCPDKPNCVSSFATLSQHIEGLTYSGDAALAMQRLRKVTLAQPRMELIEAQEGYLHFVQTSLIMRFKDDLEFVQDHAAHIFHVRSASRVGHSDFGVNRKRVELIRQAFNADGAP